MPWFQVPENIKKRVCIYLLQRYLGQFFEEKLTLDQLSVDLYNGTGTVKNISLDVQALNELGEKQNWPMEFVDGYVEELFVSIPWGSLLKDSSFIEVRGLKITVQPKQRNESATSMFESMWSSMTNSMQLAEECVKQDPTNAMDSAQPLEVIERFAQTIDSILSRVKVKFTNSLIQIEHVPKDSSTGVAVQIKIPHMEYMDAAGNDPPTDGTVDPNNLEQNKAFVVSSFTTKNFYFQGVTLSTVEFPSRARTFSRSVIFQSNISNTQEEDSLITMVEKSFKMETGECSDYTDTEEDQMAQSNEFENERHVIQFGRLVGKQQISVRLKQSEEVRGPKVSLSVEFGSLILFLSPRQVHVLLELANGIASPDLEDTSNVSARQKCVEKPMSGLDYQRIEQELQQNIHPSYTFQSPGLQGIQGWSTAALEESDSDENYLPMQGASMGSGIMCDSTLSGISSSMESSLSSSMMSSSTEPSRKTRHRVSNIDSDPTAEISHFNVTVASFALVILHEDILTLCADQDQMLLPSSIRQMQNTSEQFFGNLGIFGNKDFESAKVQFEKACSLNHLRLLAAPLHIEVNETTTLSAFAISGKLTAAKLELLECLNYGKGERVEYINLLCFNESSGSLAGGPLSSKPSLKLAFKHVEKTAKTAISRLSSVPKTDLTITLEPCIVEIDITIVDRICAILNPHPICVVIKQPTNVWSTVPTATTISPQPETRVDFKIVSPSIDFRLRFPIPDFRPAHDMQRVPWWKRNVRPDYLVFVLNDFTFNTNWCTSQPCQKYIFQCATGDISYVEADTDILHPIARLGTMEKQTNSFQDGSNVPRLTLKIYPKIKSEMELEQNVEVEPSIMNQSMYGALEQHTEDRGPFSTKRIVHESNTHHYKSQQEDTEELVIPGDKQEMADFISATTQNAQVHIELSLPSVSLQFISKHIYELIYNRINNDLLLWEPSSPKPKPVQVIDSLYTFVAPTLADGQELFSMCRSGIKFDSDSDTDEDESEIGETFYSTYERSKSQRKQLRVVEPKGQSYLVLNIHIGNGLLCMNVPVRDVATNVIPGQHGEFLFNVEDATIFTVTGYRGDDNLGFVSVQASNAQLYHCDMISSPSQSPPLKQVGTAVQRHLHPTIYKSEPGVLVNSTDRSVNRDMVSVAVRIQANHETHHVKTVRVALGISKATLKHRVCQEPNSWITQMIDIFNVLDYPIPGYHAKEVLTELHLHVWDCAIDYRPLYLPIRSVVTMDNFTMSSHLSAQANTSTLRFIFEDCALFLSEKSPPKAGVPSLTPIDLKRDYINVIDVGLFELSLKTTDRTSGINPHIDLRASNNIVHIRTCADSGRALTQLITYFAGDGDLISIETSYSVPSNFSSPRHQPEQELVNVEPQDISNLSKSQHQHVNDLLGEAMKESVSVEDESDEINNLGAKMFFFPDESNPIVALGQPPLQVTRELGDVAFRSNKSSDTDDDFCFVGDEAGLGILPRNGIPEIRWLTDDGLRIIDNHFSIPVGKTDLLKPPKNFPTPVMRYTLCEMSVVWHMYGGNDFKSDNKQKKSVNFSDLRTGVCYSNSRSGEVIFTSTQKKKTNVTWQVQGGANRDHDVLMELQLNKVRFQHEVYPENTSQASRQVLLVSELEIRDRLASSQINKFLYQYTSQSRPKQSHAHMIVIKAIHIRPDPKLKTQECCLKISLLPLRLNIDQDSLLFLIGFFSELSGETPKNEELQNPSSKHSTPTHQPPIMTIKVENEEEIVEQAQKMVDDNLLILLEENKALEESGEVSKTTPASIEDSPPVYFRNVIFSPEVPIRLDYQGKRVDMTHGPLPGLLMGLGQLNCSELKLKRLSHRHGLLGLEKLVSYCLHEWLHDIKKNQLPSLLGGVGPMHSVVQLFQGIRDLFWLPIEQYQKDGRIVRGLQRGANSFTTSTAMAALELTSRIIHLIQITAETAYDMVSPGPSVRRRTKSKGRKKRYAQPQDIREGMANAYMLVKEGIGETADNLVRVASHEHEQKGYSGAVGGVLRQIPPTVVKPIIIATEATNNVLGGMQSQLVPDARREAKQKWRTDDDG
ncbi:hypothetical protein PPYR_06910 [Photinus pyralis]|uniref:Autophagy-related protein 2 n=1 Tax=Photinus pyralis TaxID=7054 RepID=A0A5N4ANX6_PHOPY|nr:autophagy-related protein 2 homolog A [Photinus pyralis]KAB0799030.1 hypothetical protein PPYR_06910 [Photinus pyralis]